jgi:hypothetical protein
VLPHSIKEWLDVSEPPVLIIAANRAMLISRAGIFLFDDVMLEHPMWDRTGTPIPGEPVGQFVHSKAGNACRECNHGGVGQATSSDVRLSFCS